MQREQIIKLLMFIGDNYESFNEKLKDKNRAKSIIDMWNSCLSDLSYDLVLQGIKKTILTSKYPPTIAEVRENCYSFVSEEVNSIDLWNECFKMLSSGNNMPKHIFEQYPFECQKFFGSPQQLSQMALDENINIDVVRSNFLKVCSKLQERQKQDNLLPKDLRIGAMIGNISKKMELEQ